MRNKISTICSTLVFILILALLGIFGATGFMVGVVAVKVLAAAMLYIILVRVPIALMDRTERTKSESLRTKMNAGVSESLNKIAQEAAKMNVKIPSIDHPIIPPMPADED